MGFLNGSLACTRFNVVSLPDPVNFDAAAFRMIQPGSNIVETSGFVPFELDEPMTFGKHRYAFRVRMDKISPDGTLVQERLRELIKTDMDRGERMTPKKRKKLKELAEDEIRSQTLPRSKIIEGVIDHDVLYIGSTSNNHLGTVLALLQKVGVEVEYKTPWLDAALDEEEESDLVDLKEPGQSMHGCKFLKALLEDGEVTCEPEKGSVKLATNTHAKVTLTGEVLGELDHYLEDGAELLSAKVIFGEMPFTLDGLAYRISGLKLPKIKEDHWTQTLEGRLELLESVWEMLDEKFAKLMGIELPKRKRPRVVEDNQKKKANSSPPIHVDMKAYRRLLEDLPSGLAEFVHQALSSAHESAWVEIQAFPESHTADNWPLGTLVASHSNPRLPDAWISIKTDIGWRLMNGNTLPEPPDLAVFVLPFRDSGNV